MTDSDIESPPLPPINPRRDAPLIDVSGRPDAVRTAVAAGRVLLGEKAFERVQQKKVQKGDVLTVAQVAGIQAAKKTSSLLPLCNGLNVQGIDIEFALDEEDAAIDVRAFVKTVGPTGVEMEAMTAASVAALTIYDMCKSVSRGIEITDIHLLAKTGGQRGDYRRGEEE